jgi:cysteine-rich repeat protein
MFFYALRVNFICHFPFLITTLRHIQYAVTVKESAGKVSTASLCLVSYSILHHSHFVSFHSQTACDDGNVQNGDGCSATCSQEAGWACSGGSASSRDVCTTVCGDLLTKGSERCDDGANIDGDGCSATCAVESGWACKANVCRQDICGDGKRTGPTGCSDKIRGGPQCLEGRIQGNYGVLYSL